MVFATGLAEPIFLYQTSDMLPICTIPSLNSRYFKVNGDQLFLKSQTLGRWCVVSLQESSIVTTLQARAHLEDNARKVQKILYDYVPGDKASYLVGIGGDKPVTMHPAIILSKYRSFNGLVKAVDLS
jgi:hypothetical protein